MGDSGLFTEKMKTLRMRMRKLGIRDVDIEEKFIKSSGKGGQNVNKVATCVQLKHCPTGIEVKVQQERSQYMNRLTARRILCDKYEEAIQREKIEQRKKAEKVRRQKRKRSRTAKEKILRNKHIQADKKKHRKPVNED